MEKHKLLFALLICCCLVGNAQVTLTLQPDACSGKDAFLAFTTPSTNYGSHEDFGSAFWTCGGSPCEGKSLLQFDLSSIPQGSTINSATLSLYANLTSGNGYPGTPMWGTDNACYLNRVTSVWTETGVTWNTTPSFTTTDQVLLAQSASTTQDYPGIDITAFAQYWFQNPTENYGMLIDIIASNAYNSLLFCSSDYTDPARRPKLEVCYSLPTGIREINDQTGAEVFPNPALTEINLNLGNLQAEAVSLYSIEGKLLCVIQEPEHNRVDVSQLAKGVYIAEIKVQGDVQKVRWVKM